MPIRFFSIPALHPEPAASELNHCLATQRVAQVERSLAAFMADAPAQLARVQEALLAGRLPDGRLRVFAIQDPKPRLIHAAPFADRVAHHALMRQMAGRLEQALVPTSFACRPGLGLHAALLHAQRQMLAQPACTGHARYMDDVLLWCASRTDALALAEAVAGFCDASLGLLLKPPVLAPVKAGMAFCGMRLGPHGLRPGRRRQRAWAGRWRALQADWQGGALDETQAQQRCEVLRALCLPARPLAWQRGVMGAGLDMEMMR